MAFYLFTHPQGLSLDYPEIGLTAVSGKVYDFGATTPPTAGGYFASNAGPATGSFQFGSTALLQVPNPPRASGVAASRPAAGVFGEGYWYSTDTGSYDYSNGTTWTSYVFLTGAGADGVYLSQAAGVGKVKGATDAALTASIAAANATFAALAGVNVFTQKQSFRGAFTSRSATDLQILAKPSTDTSDAVIDWLIDSVKFGTHFVTGPNADRTTALAAYGVDENGRAILISNKKTGQGLVAINNTTVTAPDGYVMFVENRTTAAPGAVFSQTGAGTKAALVVSSDGTSTGTDEQQVWQGAPGGVFAKFGSVQSATGLLKWLKDIEVSGGSKLAVSSGAATSALELNANAGQTRQIRYQTGGSNRWQLSVDNSAETGVNAGSAFILNAYTDAGGFLGTVFSANRADQRLNVHGPLRHLGTTLGFYNAAVVTKPSVTGSRGANAALDSLLTALANLGLVTNDSTA